MTQQVKIAPPVNATSLIFMQASMQIIVTNYIPLNECNELLSLYENKKKSSKEVKKITLEKISQIDIKLKDLKASKIELSYLANNCHSDNKPSCPILDEIAKI